MLPVERFRGLRRLIAVALDGRKRTLYELSKAVGRRPGDIQRTVRQMLAEGLLEANSPEPTRGTLFWLNEDFADELAEVVASHNAPGQLAPEQRVLQLASPPDRDPFAILARPDLNGLVEWFIEWGGDGEMLVGMTRDAERLAAERLTGALRKAGISCLQRRVGEVGDRAALRALTTGVLDEVEEATT
jgi:hypothetical protein